VIRLVKSKPYFEQMKITKKPWRVFPFSGASKSFDTQEEAIQYLAEVVASGNGLKDITQNNRRVSAKTIFTFLRHAKLRIVPR